MAPARTPVVPRPRRPWPALLCALLLGAPVAAAQVEDYRLDPVHTRVLFAVSHAGFSKALGTVSGSTGTLRFDPAHFEAATVDVRVPLANLDLGDPRWNAAARTANLLDTARHPDARFVSTSVKATGENRLQACGNLTLHGVTRPLCLDVTVNAIKRHPMPPFRRTAGFSATATLRRSDFGVDAWPSVIGDEVELRIEAEAQRARASTEPAEPAEPAAR